MSREKEKELDELIEKARVQFLQLFDKFQKIKNYPEIKARGRSGRFGSTLET